MRGQGTGWTNFQTYMGLNKPQTDAMVNNVAGGVERDAANATGAIGSASSMFNLQAGAGTNRYNEADTLTSAEAQRRADRGYTGPNSLTDVDPRLGEKVDKATAALNGTPGSLLSGAYGKNAPYSAGGRTLDSVLFGAGGGGDRLEAAKKKYGNLGGALESAQNVAMSTAQAARAQSVDAGNQYAQLYGKLYGAEQEIAKRKADEDARRKKGDEYAAYADKVNKSVDRERDYRSAARRDSFFPFM